MGKILQFPSADNDRFWTLQSMVGLAEEMNNLFTEADVLRVEMEKCEYKAKMLQEGYDILLKEYVKKVGVNNLEPEMQQYSPTAIVECDVEEKPYTYTIRWGDSKPYPYKPENMKNE